MPKKIFTFHFCILLVIFLIFFLLYCKLIKKALRIGKKNFESKMNFKVKFFNSFLSFVSSFILMFSFEASWSIRFSEFPAEGTNSLTIRFEREFHQLNSKKDQKYIQHSVCDFKWVGFEKKNRLEKYQRFQRFSSKEVHFF